MAAIAPVRDAMAAVPTTGIGLHFRDWGGDGPVVILAHGLASSCRMYDLCAPLLVPRYRVIAYDQRGHGLSEKQDDGYDFDTLVADGMGLLEALGIDTPYTVVGHSWGASVALNWAARHPDAVHAAVLVDGGVFSFRDMPGATWESVSERLSPPDLTHLTFDALLQRSRGGDLAFLDDAFRREFYGSLMEIAPDGTIRPRLTRARHMAILRSMWDMDLQAAYDMLLRPALALVAVPAQSRAEQQQLFETRRASIERLQANCPLLEVQWAPDTIHDLPLQRPALLAEAIARVAGP